MIQASAVCSRSNSLTWISPWRAVERQWIRLKRRPGRTAGRSWPAASSGACARAQAWLPSRLAAGSRHSGQRLEARVDDDADALPTVAEDSKNPNGSPVRMCSGSIRKWPRRVSGARMSHDRSRAAAEGDGPAGQAAGQRRRVVDLQPGLREPARVAQRVGHPHPVADVAAAAG